MYEKYLLKEIEELSKEVVEVRKVLDDISWVINETELTLMKLNLNIEFQFSVKDVDRDSYSFLCWQEDKKSNKYRLIYKNIMYDEKDNGTIIEKPLIECDIKKRIVYGSYIYEFLKEFRIFIKNKREMFEKNFKEKKEE